jgi:Amt family ammonium transporter
MELKQCRDRVGTFRFYVPTTDSYEGEKALSRGKTFVALSLLTFIILVVLGARWGHNGPADPTGTKTGGVADYQTATGGDSSSTEVPLSQVGVNQLANEAGHLRVSINFGWTLVTGFLVLFMQVGFAFLVTGLTRAKNAGHMMMMNISAFAVAFIAYYAVGFAFHFGGIAPVANLGGLAPLDGIFGHGNSGVIGTHGFLLQSHGGYDVGVLAMFLFQVVFMETAGYIIIGAIAERISFAGFILAELAMGAVIYPIFGNWVWGGGWLAHLGDSLGLGHGSVDFAGSGVVHATGGWTALALAIMLGARIGKFNKDGTPNAIPGHNLGYVVIGTLVLVFGWMGFNPGSTLGATDLRISVVAVNTLLAACFGFVAAMAWTNYKWGKPDISMSCNGMLAGLVAITAPCAFVAPWAAAVIGLLAGFLVCLGVWFFDHIGRVDDPCGAVSVHGLCGAFGVFSVGLFADGTYGAGWNGVAGPVKGLFYGDAGQLGAQMFEVVIGVVWAMGITFIIFGIAKRFMKIRVSAEAEIEGLDVPEFGALCYPDFVLHKAPAGHVISGSADPEVALAATGPPSTAGIMGDGPSASDEPEVPRS